MSISPSVRKMIESMGFKLKGCQYEAKFYDDSSGTIISVDIVEDADATGQSVLRFRSFDECGVLTSNLTLDQMMFVYDAHLKPLPKPSTNEYACVLSLRVQVPVEMWKTTPETYMKYIMEGCTSDKEIAKHVATAQLREFFAKSAFNIIEVDHEHTDRIGGEPDEETN